MKNDDNDLLRAALNEPSQAGKVWLVLIIAGVVVLTPIVWTKWNKPNDPTKYNTPDATKPAINNVDGRISELSAQNEKLRAELASKIKKTERSSETKSVNEWNKLLNQIVVKLERVTKESENFQSARLQKDLETEEARLKALVREQESAARSLVFELEALKFPQSKELDHLVKQFANDYSHFVTYRRLLWQSIRSLGTVSKDLETKGYDFQAACYTRLSEIKAMVKRI